MRRMKASAFCFVLLASFGCLQLAGCAGAQAPPAETNDKPKPQDAQSTAIVDEVMKQFQAERVVFDGKAGTVTIPAVVNQPPDPVEYLLIHKRGKRHEAMFWTPSKPSVINAALLMLGMTPGQNATYTEKKPAPTLQEIENGADPLIITPPKGTTFWMTAKWKGEDGKEVEHCVEDLILDMSSGKAVADCSWVYLGGRMARIYKNDPEVYIADFEGNLISICYLSPDNHLGTMSHDSARDDQNWWMTDAMPKAETEVQFVFHRQPSALHKERQARLLREKEAARKGDADKGAAKKPDEKKPDEKK